MKFHGIGGGIYAAVPIRLPHVMAAQVDPMIFQFYKSFACFSSAWLLLLFVVNISQPYSRDI